MNIQFLIGFGSALLVATKDGRKILDKVTKTVGEVAESSVKMGVDVFKEALPDTAKILGVLKEDVSQTSESDTI